MKISVLYILILNVIILLTVSCNNNKPLNKDAVSTLKDSISVIDSLFKSRNHGNIKVYYKTKESNKFIELKDFNTHVDDVSEIVNLCYSNSGDLLAYKYIPTSESGDNFQTLTHYFNTKGNTVVYKTTSSFFGDDCSMPEKTITETNTIYFDNSFKALKKEYRLTDEDKKPVNPKKCILNYSIEDKPYKSTSLIPILKKLNIK